LFFFDALFIFRPSMNSSSLNFKARLLFLLLTNAPEGDFNKCNNDIINCNGVSNNVNGFWWKNEKLYHVRPVQ